MMRTICAVGMIAVALTACGTTTDESPHAWCEEDETDQLVQDSYCFEGITGYEWEYDDPSYNPMLVPYFISVPDPAHPGRTKQITTYKPPVPGYKPPPNYKPPAPAPVYKAPPPAAPVPKYNPPAPAPRYVPPPPPPKVGK